MSAPVTGGAAAEAGPSFDAVVGSVEDALETLRKIAELSQNVVEGSEGAVGTQVNVLVEHLQAIDNHKIPVAHTEVPNEVFELLDQGLSPDQLTRDRYLAVEQQSQREAGQKETFESFEKLILKKLHAENPAAAAAAVAAAAAATAAGGGGGGAAAPAEAAKT
eukprot:gene6526-10747_t